MAFFGSSSNPLSTPVGQLIERSIDPSNSSTFLELHFEICDLINTREEIAKDAMKAIRKELSIYVGKNWSVVSKLLLLIETCSNNCTKRFQILLANKDFLQELKQMILPKYQPPLDIQEKVLFLIQHWAIIFKNDSDFKPVESLYSELRSKGVDFPVYDPDKSLRTLEIKPDTQEIPIRDEPRVNSNPMAAAPSAMRPAMVHDQRPRINDPQISMSSAIKLNEEQLAKLNSEIDVVENNVQVFNEILTEFQNNANLSKLYQQNDSMVEKDITLIKELNKTCREMQKRITQLIGNVSNENIINELLRVNDDLNNAFLRYERFEKNLNSYNRQNESNNNNNLGATGSSSQLPKPLSPKPKSSDEKPLIDFSDIQDDVNDISKSMNNVKLSSNNNTNYDENSEANQFLHDENEIREMENWLKSQAGGANNDLNGVNLDLLSNGSSSNPQRTNETGSNSDSKRSIKNDDKSLFSL